MTFVNKCDFTEEYDPISWNKYFCGNFKYESHNYTGIELRVSMNYVN